MPFSMGRSHVTFFTVPEHINIAPRTGCAAAIKHNVTRVLYPPFNTHFNPLSLSKCLSTYNKCFSSHRKKLFVYDFLNKKKLAMICCVWCILWFYSSRERRARNILYMHKMKKKKKKKGKNMALFMLRGRRRVFNCSLNCTGLHQ